MKNIQRIRDDKGKTKILFDGCIYDEKLFFGESKPKNPLVRYVKDKCPPQYFGILRSGLHQLRNILKMLNPFLWQKDKNYKKLSKEIDSLKYEVGKLSKTYREDMLILFGYKNELFEDPQVKCITDYPVAVSSNDHLHPEGTAVDDTRHPRFVFAIEKMIKKPQPLSVVDFGCSGGGLVFDFLLRGHFAIGLEGSDFSLKSQRTHWRVIPNHLFTCDITKPFHIVRNSKPLKKVDLVTAWEFFEHIPTESIKCVFDNIDNLIDSNGFFVGSIGTSVSFASDGHPLHMTVEPKSWWEQKFLEHGYEIIEDHSLNYEDFCRGTGNTPQDPDFRTSPIGFHFVSRKL